MSRYAQQSPSTYDMNHAKRATLLTFVTFVATLPIYALMIFLTFPPEAGSEGVSSAVQTLPAIIMLVLIFLATLTALFILPGRSAPERLAERGLTTGQALYAMAQSFSIRYSVIEIVPLIGFVLSFLNRQMHYYLLGGIYALIMFILLFVRRGSEFAEFEKHFSE